MLAECSAARLVLRRDKRLVSNRAERARRWAVCEAYRSSNSDLKLLRQLLLEKGFWAVKGEADRIYRAAACQQPAAANARSANDGNVPERGPQDTALGRTLSTSNGAVVQVRVAAESCSSACPAIGSRPC